MRMLRLTYLFRFSMCSGIAHDPLQRDIFTPLFFGASIHIPTQEDITTPGRLAEWMREQQVGRQVLRLLWALFSAFSR